MNVNITFRHTDSSDVLREHVTKSLENLTRHTIKAIGADVVFDVEKYRHFVEITLYDKDHTFHAEAESNDMYTSVDMVIAKLETQLHRHKDKLTHHKNYRKSKQGRLGSATTLHDQEHLAKGAVRRKKPSSG